MTMYTWSLIDCVTSRNFCARDQMAEMVAGALMPSEPESVSEAGRPGNEVEPRGGAVPAQLVRLQYCTKSFPLIFGNVGYPDTAG